MKTIGLPREAGSHPADNAAGTPREAIASLMCERPFGNPFNGRFGVGNSSTASRGISLAQGDRHALANFTQVVADANIDVARFPHWDGDDGIMELCPVKASNLEAMSEGARASGMRNGHWKTAKLLHGLF